MNARGVCACATAGPEWLRTLYRDHERFLQTYFSTYPGLYFTGDGARRDADGYYWITGRIDDVINVSGHRLGTAEVESALVAHAKVAEAAVVGYPHSLKGQGIYAYVTLKASAEPSEALRSELERWVRKQIGPIAALDHDPVGAERCPRPAREKSCAASCARSRRTTARISVISRRSPIPP